VFHPRCRAARFAARRRNVRRSEDRLTLPATDALTALLIGGVVGRVTVGADDPDAHGDKAPQLWASVRKEEFLPACYPKSRSAEARPPQPDFAIAKRELMSRSFYCT